MVGFFPVTGPRCVVEIFPWEAGSSFSISSQGTRARIISCTVQRDIRAVSGNFEIVLDPGGPTGIDGAPTWVDVITPLSTCTIGMQRGDRAGVVMIGVVTEVRETTMMENHRVARTTTITGKDIGYFWENFSFFSLAALGILGVKVDALGPSISELSNIVAKLADPTLLAGLLTGDPADVAEHWYNTIMLGLLQNSSIINNGQKIPVGDAIAEFIEAYPNFRIPFGVHFMDSDIIFSEKIKSILEWPFYEVFYATLPEDFQSSIDMEHPGTTFSVTDIKATAKPWFVGRLNPIPVLTNDLSEIDTTQWDFLTTNEPDAGFISSTMKFSSGEVANFYMLQSNALRQLIGKANGSAIAPGLYINVAADFTSLTRYGYRPHFQTTSWLNDMEGNYAKNNSAEFDDMTNDLIAKLCSWYHPIPLMAEAEVVYPLMPDVYIGTKFAYNPKKYPLEWTFYIRSVTHDFRFGGPTTTTLGLERGLPSEVYADSSLLQSVYVGTAERFNAEYSITDAEGLVLKKVLDGDMADLLHKIEDLIIKPQANIVKE